jgi:hypothetical protein
MIINEIQKQHEVKRFAWIDFRRDLAAGETILDPGPVCTAYNAGDDSLYPAFLVSTPIVVGTIVYQRVEGGEIGQKVIVKFHCITSQGNELNDSLRFVITRY